MKIWFIGLDKLCQCKVEAGNTNLVINACNDPIQINDFRAALNKDSNLERANQGLRKAQKIQSKFRRFLSNWSSNNLRIRPILFFVFLLAFLQTAFLRIFLISGFSHDH